MPWKRLRDRKNRRLPSPKKREPTELHHGPSHWAFRGEQLRGLPPRLAGLVVAAYIVAIFIRNPDPVFLLAVILTFSIFGILSAVIVRRLETKLWSWIFLSIFLLILLGWIWHDPSLLPLLAGLTGVILASAAVIHLVKRRTATPDWRKEIDER